MNQRPPTPLLDRLSGENRIVSVELQHNGLFRIREECDGYFQRDFTALQITELAGELLALAVYAYSIA